MIGPTGISARPGFRTRPPPPAGVQDVDKFSRQSETPRAPVFDMHAMHAEMEALHARMPPQVRSSPNAWAHELQQQQKQPQPPLDPRIAHQLSAPHQIDSGPSWGKEFHADLSRMTEMRGTRGDTMSLRAPVGGGMGVGMNMGMGMYGVGQSGMFLGHGMLSNMSRPEAHANNPRVVELDHAKWDEQFRRMEEADAEAQAELPSQTDSSSRDQMREPDDNEALALKELREMEARLRDEVQDENPRFEELWNALKDPSLLEKSDDLAKWEEQLMEAVAAEDPINSTHPGGGLGPGVLGLEEEDGLGEAEALLRNELNEVDESGFPTLGAYEFEANNPFATHPAPYAEGIRLVENNGNLTDATRLFEVATQRDQDNISTDEIDRTRAEKSRAWQKLGETHAMNEHEEKAIQALVQALNIDASNLGAHLSLAVSYINEGYDQAANATLLKYMARSRPHLAPSNNFPPLETERTDPWARLNYVRDLFLKAAREDAAHGVMDPEIQVGLGLLFYSTSSYEQAKDCFQAALESRPNDWQLWNRLGATLANGGNSELATEAYHRALELRPSFTRAIYNLSVSCMNLGAHHEAAEHLLSALALQRSQSVPDTPASTTMPPPLSHARESESLWNTLRSIMTVMNRIDLANQCHVGSDLHVFRRAGFEF